MRLFRNKKAEILQEQLQQQQQEIKSLINSQNSLREQIAASIRDALQPQTINDSIARFPDFTISQTTNKYITNDKVYSVINKIGGRSAFIPAYSYIKKDDTALKKYHASQKAEFYTTKALVDLKLKQVKALTDAPEDDELNQLLNTPNPYQTKIDFFLSAYTYYLLNGECFIWKERVSAGANGGKVKRLHIWSPEQVVLHVTRQYPHEVVRYSFIVDGQEVMFALPKDMIHWKTNNPAKLCFNQQDFRGLSPLKPLTNTITRMSESDVRSVSMIKNGGLPGIVYDETSGADEIKQGEFDLQKKAFYDHVTNPDNTGAPFFVGGKKGYVSTGLNMGDLKLLEVNRVDDKRLYNAYKVSDVLFNSDAASTESNVQEMTKQMILHACLPMIHSLNDKLNNGLAVEFKRVLDVDISEIPELQDDLKDMAMAVSAMPAAPSVNEQRELFNYEAIGDIDDQNNPYNKPLIKQGYTFIEDMGMQDINENDLNANDLNA